MEQNTELQSDVNNEEMQESINPATPPILVESPPLTDSFVQMMDISESNTQGTLSQEPVVINDGIENPDNGNSVELDTSTPPILVESPPLTESLIQMIGDAEKASMASVEPGHTEQQNDNNTDSNGFEYVDSIRIASMETDQINNESFSEETDVLKEEANGGEKSADKTETVETAQESGDAGGAQKEKPTTVPPVVEDQTAPLGDDKPAKSCSWDYNMMAYISVGIAVLAGLTYFVLKRRVK